MGTPGNSSRRDTESPAYAVEITPSNRKQALIPAETEVLPNPCGTQHLV